jgi:putative NIF3 family GTP cyclohydrolase 1 type 2
MLWFWRDRGWKRLNLANGANAETVKQEIIMKLVAHGISLYCPHTSLDNAYDGSKFSVFIFTSKYLAWERFPSYFADRKRLQNDLVVNDWLASGLSRLEIAKICPIAPTEDSTVQRPEGAGRLVTLQNPKSPQDVIQAVKQHLNLNHGN